jgi:hypothetical protein
MTKAIKFADIAIMLIGMALPTYGQDGIKDPAGKKALFVHPGMMQSNADLVFMKENVAKGVQPWKDAFERLKAGTPLLAVPKPSTHISQGPYGASDMGGKQLMDDAGAAYNNALLWVITGNKSYASNSIRLLNAWSYNLWDFDDNNAKLLAGLSGYYLLNAAEILKYTPSEWGAKDIGQFKRLMLTVYYPLIKDFFPEANGNWDASMINTMLCIAIFCDDRPMFDQALQKYLYGDGNGGITKYIYPGGQIQESTRDWGHVQLGLGEFAKAAQVAWTQGVDLYRVADNRLASGFEYASKYMLGGDVPVYGSISPRERTNFRDIYESIYDHYRSVKRIELPYTARVIELTRPKSSLVLLTSLRSRARDTDKSSVIPFPGIAALYTGAADRPARPAPGVLMMNVAPDSSIQAALDRCAGKKGWVILENAVYQLNAPLRIASGVTLAGKGKGSVLFLEPSIGTEVMINAEDNMHDITIKDLVLEGAASINEGTDPNNNRRTRSFQNAPARAGILFQSDARAPMRNIILERVTVRNFTKNGVSIKGAEGVTIDSCDFTGNGSSVVPGPGIHHNLKLTRIREGKITNSRFDDSPWGSGIDLAMSRNIFISGNETARNRLQGIRCADCNNVSIGNCLSEGNDGNGFLADVLLDGNKSISVHDNLSRNNGMQGISVDAADKKIIHNVSVDNGRLSFGINKLPRHTAPGNN